MYPGRNQARRDLIEQFFGPVQDALDEREDVEIRAVLAEAVASECLASPDSKRVASGAVRPSDGASQDPSVPPERINPSIVLRCSLIRLRSEHAVVT